MCAGFKQEPLPPILSLKPRFLTLNLLNRDVREMALWTRSQADPSSFDDLLRAQKYRNEG